MKCHKCGEKIEKELKKCPFCGTDLKTINDLDLPELRENSEVVDLEDTDSNLTDNYFEVELKDKEENENSDKYDIAESSIDKGDVEFDDELIDTKEFDLSLEKTKSINPLTDTIELKNISLIDDINRQINEMNKEAIEEKKSEESLENKIKEEKLIDDSDLSSLESLKKRKRVLLFVGIGSLLLAIGMIIFIIVGGTNKDTIKGDYLIVLEDSLNKYYETLEYDEIIRVLNTVKKDDDKIANVQNKTKEYVVKWFEEYVDTDIKTLGDFEDVSKEYRSLINELHIHALITYDNRIIKAFKDADFDEIESKMDTLYNDSSLYFVAMDYYNQNDYNKAYTTFLRIESSNTYYEKANSYKEKIYNNVFQLLEKDINKIISGVEDANDYKKLEIYSSVEEVLIQYSNIYFELNLKNRSEYQILLNEYNDLVSEYTNRLSGEKSNQQDNENNLDANENS